MSKNTHIITIDGLAGSGKSAVSKKLSQNLGFYLLDSGILYRTFAYIKNIENINAFNKDNIGYLMSHLSLVPTNDLRFNIVFKNNDITNKLYSEEIGLAASVVSKIELLRLALLDLQHECIRDPGLIANGRDMGTKVFPNAILKLYFTANLNIRAERRYNQLLSNDSTANIEDIKKSLQDRDEKDINRDISPLKAAKDAIIIDSSELNIESVLDKILELYNIKELEI